jgi:TatD DNase family protein
MLIDAHSHVDRYTDKLSEALDQIERNRILTISVAMDIESFTRATELSRLSKYLIPTFGIHPWEAPRYHDKLSDLDQYLKLTPLIGEAGLDFHFIKDTSLYPYQQEIFEYQCTWARRMSKPMNLHTKGAEQEVLEALRKYHIVCPSWVLFYYRGRSTDIGIDSKNCENDPAGSSFSGNR